MAEFTYNVILDIALGGCFPFEFYKKETPKRTTFHRLKDDSVVPKDKFPSAEFIDAILPCSEHIDKAIECRKRHERMTALEAQIADIEKDMGMRISTAKPAFYERLEERLGELKTKYHCTAVYNPRTKKNVIRYFRPGGMPIPKNDISEDIFPSIVTKTADMIDVESYIKMMNEIPMLLEKKKRLEDTLEKLKSVVDVENYAEIAKEHIKRKNKSIKMKQILRSGEANAWRPVPQTDSGEDRNVKRLKQSK